MKTVDVKEQTAAVALTRKEKLTRWAELIRAEKKHLFIFHGIEGWNWMRLSAPMSAHATPGGDFTTAFCIAAADPVFRAAGLAGDSIANSMRFFDLSQHDIHAFSCDCGGVITKDALASRVEGLANGPLQTGIGGPGGFSFTAALMQLFQ
jgi:hypothetical protein